MTGKGLKVEGKGGARIYGVRAASSILTRHIGGLNTHIFSKLVDGPIYSWSIVTRMEGRLNK